MANIEMKISKGHSISYLLIVSFLLFHGVNFVKGVEYYVEKPAYLKTCKISDPEFVKCSTDSIQHLLDHMLTTGIPELEAAIGPLDPFKMKEIIYNRDNNEVATIKANLTDIDAIGFSKLTVKESKVSNKNYNWDTKCFIPNLRLDGDYKMNGRILLIPLKGGGKFFIDMEGVNIAMHTTVKLYEKGGFTFFNVTKEHVQIKLRGLKVNFDNLFNGKSKEVEKSTNQFFNENWPELFEALKPVIYETVEQIIFKVLKKTFDLLPAKFLIEDIPTSKELYGEKR